MIIEYGFINPENGMNMNAIVFNVLECSFSGDTLYFLYLGPKGEKIEMKKNIDELTSFMLKK